MSNNPITQSAFKNVKKRAKCIRKDQKIKHMEALDIAAHEAGYQDYREFEKAFSSPASLIINQAYVSDLLSKIIKSEYVQRAIREGLRMIPELSNSEKYFWDAFSKGIPPNGKLHSNHYKIFAFGMDKESLKKEGYQLISSDEMEDRVTGYLAIAIAHFFRSIAACIEDRREEHAPFNTYMSDWIDSCNLIPEEDEAYRTLVNSFPINVNVRMLPGSTTWGSVAGDNYEGRKPTRDTNSVH